jgi:hypothetical protein
VPPPLPPPVVFIAGDTAATGVGFTFADLLQLRRMGKKEKIRSFFMLVNLYAKLSGPLHLLILL